MSWSLLERELSRDPFAGFFDDFFGGRRQHLGRNAASAVAPLNAYLSENDALVQLELPGVDPNAIDVSIDGRQLVITGERAAYEPKEGERIHRRELYAGRFERRAQMPFRIDPNDVDASYDDVLAAARAPVGAPDADAEDAEDGDEENA